jgi:acid phosphatase (class A)
MNKFNNQKLISLSIWIIISVSTILFISGCASSKTSLSAGVEEVKPGIMAGYLEFKQLPNSVALLPAPPVDGSTAFILDTEISKTYLEQSDTAAWKQAQIDAELYFPEALESFSSAAAFPISEEKTPNLYILLRRTLGDASLSTYAAKKQYMRPRPFMVNNKPTCTPELEDHLKDGSYPSGHAAIGWAWALVLAEIFPERTNHIIERGRSYGQSRVVCNVHWQSDVNEGRFIGAATVARLHANPMFQADLKAAKKDVSRIRAEN